MGGKPSKSSRHYQHQQSQAYPPAYSTGHGYGQPGQPTQAQEQVMVRSRAEDVRRKYGLIPDNFRNVQQVQEKLRQVGLESSNLIVGVDFTKSNEWTGRDSFGGRCLHTIGPETNPYELAISAIGQCLSTFDEDNLIPAFGFGDVTTHDTAVFSFYPNNEPCRGFEDVLGRYRALVPNVQLSGPTSFAPIVEAAGRTVELSGGQYHVLLIIADGQVTRSSDLPDDVLSVQEKATVDALTAASNYPLSIVLVGVGDGPWDTMQAFDDLLPTRNFDNFQFVDLMSILGSRSLPLEAKAARFALMALMEIPFQFKACAELGLLGKRVGRLPPTEPLPPPRTVLDADARAAALAGLGLPLSGRAAASAAQGGGSGLDAQAGMPNPDTRECPVCLQHPKDTAFQCGHQVCGTCGAKLVDCPICRTPVALRIKLYS